MIVSAIQWIRESEVSRWSRDTPEKFHELLQLTLIQQTQLNHPPVKYRLVIAETLFGSINKLQSGRRELQPALSGVLHHSPGLQCRKRAHV